MKEALIGLALSLSFALPLAAAPLPAEVVAPMRAADVVMLGEIHDNPAHHLIQAEALAALAPRAVVWEMMTAETAAQVTAEVIDDPDRLAEVTGWDDSGWPPLAEYLPVFRAARGARNYGALVPRAAVGTVMAEGLSASFGPEATEFGLTDPLPEAEQVAREADQQAAHCNAMPADKLWMLVDIQRLRDATLARTVLHALEQTGGPVAVITGNGHARADRGVPVYLRRAAPGLGLFALGQSEAGQLAGTFDAVIDAPEVARPDPCAAFAKP
ncbi:ChaN family lipoprotein [Pseudodonghicola flavimaris]|uniref:ChaN family lipoprotein n=1 Tax=Pseudodonghicola flavimaris TaxID=3050036 RepID=A0ABT7F4Q4_9RHOB|nr:ChaN family lipoprotein [Pseudodonghicola flavimaris]MDK3019586.1 ChaN family lipoprotein [Pseudodonghicola flavimaris]